MAINFPDSPTINDLFSVLDRTWIWDGTSWNSFINTPAYLPIGGTTGQILAKSDNEDYAVQWIDNSAPNIEQYVKNTTGSNIPIGTPVYISGATGDTPLISVASNDTEMESSKVIGLTKTAIANDGFGYVITEGILTGVNTDGLTAGTVMWLGVDGAIVFGTPKPVAPAHLVFLGYVIRIQSSNGSYFIKPQNGYELDELHDILIGTKANNDLLVYESSTGLWKNKTFSALDLLTVTTANSTYAKLTATQTFTGTQTIIAPSTTTQGLIVKGVASQTANLQEWQSNAGSVLAYVRSNGSIYTSGAIDESSLANGIHIGVGPIDSTPRVMFVPPGAVNSSNNWQIDISSGIFRWFTPGQTQMSLSNRSLGIGTTSTTAASLYVNGTSTSKVTIIAKPVTSQTADIQQWQNTAGTDNLAKIDISGNFTAASIIKTGGTSSQFLKADGSVDSSTYLTTGTASSTYLPLAGGTLTGTLNSLDILVGGSTETATFGVLGSATTTKWLGLFAQNGITAEQSAVLDALRNKTVSVQGNGGAYFAGRDVTNDIEFVMGTSSAGAAFVGSMTAHDLHLRTQNVTRLWVKQTSGYVGINDSAPGSQLSVIPSGAAVIGQIIKADASQTASLFEVQSNSGVALVRVNSAGTLRSIVSSEFSYGGSYADPLSGVASTVKISGAGATVALGVNSGGAAIIGQIIRGAASQTADLQQWQNSAGTALARVLPAGVFASQGSWTGSLSFSGVTWTGFSNPTGVTTLPTVIVKGIGSQTSNLQEWHNSAGTVLATLSISGVFSAVSKSFVIDHPTKPGMKLRYGSLEGPENGVYFRGQTDKNVIALPDYWVNLVDELSITVNLTPIGKYRKVFVKEIKDNQIILGGRNINCFFTVFAERKDVDKLVVEEWA